MLKRGLVGSLLILLGGIGTAVLPDSTALMRWHVVPAVRESTIGHLVAIAILLTGVVLAAQAWIALVRTVAASRHDGTEGTAALFLVRQSVLVWSLPLLVAPPLFSRDGWSYAAQGMLARLGISPYEHGPALLHGPITEGVDPRWMDSLTPYGPLPVWLGEMGAGITSNPWVLVIGHRLVALAGLVMLAWAVPRLARWSGVNPAYAAAVVLASPLMLLSGVGGLHNDLLMVGLMACALVVGVERGWAYGAVIGGLAASVKAPGGVVCIGIVLATVPVAARLKDRLWRLVGVGAVAAGTLLGLGVVTGLGHGWSKALSTPASVTTPLSSSTMVGDVVDGLTGFLDLPSHTFVDLLHTLGTVATGIALVWIVLTRRTGDRVAGLQAAALAVCATVALSPVVHPWYLLWIPPFVATLDLGRVVAAAVLVGSLVLGVNATLDAFVHTFYFGVALACLLVGVALLAQLLTAPGRARLDRLATSRWLTPDAPSELRRVLRPAHD